MIGPSCSILIIEDEKNILDFMTKALKANNYKVYTATSGQSGLALITSQCPDLVLLDLGLPDIDGNEIISSVRQWTSCPIIVVSARSNERDKVTALDLPLYIHPYQCGGLLIDFDRRIITLDGEAVHLTPVEYKIVAFLARNSGKVMTYSAIMSNIWGPYADSNNRILRVNMANIRRKLEKNPAQPEYIYTEVGVGYRMREDEFEAN